MINRGGSRIFSRGGAVFSKKNRKFWRPFFLGRANWLFKHSQSTFLPLFWQKIFCSAGKFLKKQSKRPFLGTFWKILTKNCVFFGARSPSKLVYIRAEGAFRKILGSVGQNGFLKKYQRGDPLGWQGVESPRRVEASDSPPPPPPSP